MTPEEKKKAARAAEKAFKEKRRSALSELDKIGAQSGRDIKAALKSAQKEIKEILGRQPSDFQRWRLTEIEREIDHALAQVEQRLKDLSQGVLDSGWRDGIGTIDGPLEAGREAAAAALGRTAPASLTANLAQINITQLGTLKNHTIGRMSDITHEIRNRIQSEVSAVVTGVRSISAAVSEIAGHIDGGRARALRVVHTNLGTCFNSASQARMTQVSERLPGVKFKKTWRRSGKRRSRSDHDLADGQTVDVDQPFMVGGEELMYPCDPKGSASNIINCGCRHRIWCESWDMLIPSEKEFSDAELAADPGKRYI